MRHTFQRFYIDCPAWRLRVDVHGLIQPERELAAELESVARRSPTLDALVAGLSALADRSGLVADLVTEPHWDGTSLELQVGLVAVAA
jgi:hypothetical protein